MNSKTPGQLPGIARSARAIAIGAWPAGILLGFVLSSGQDPAGAGIAVAIGIVLAAIVSAVAGLVFWIFKSHERAERIAAHKRSFISLTALATSMFIVWHIQPLVEDQRYSIVVKNGTDEPLSELSAFVAGVNVTVGSVDAKQSVTVEGHSKRPSGAVSVRWIDTQGEVHTLTASTIGGPPRRYDGGYLTVNIQSRHNASSYFLFPKDD